MAGSDAAALPAKHRELRERWKAGGSKFWSDRRLSGWDPVKQRHQLEARDGRMAN